jgi:hypothetical protein
VALLCVVTEQFVCAWLIRKSKASTRLTFSSWPDCGQLDLVFFWRGNGLDAAVILATTIFLVQQFWPAEASA